MKYFLLLIFLFLIIKLHGQPDFFLRIGLPTQYFQAADTAPNDENSIWAVTTVSQATKYDTDIVLYKISIDGVRLDSTRLNLPGNQFARSIFQATDGSLLLGGTSDRPDQDGAQDIYLRYQDREGAEIWTTTFGSDGNDDLINIFVSDANNIYVAYKAYLLDAPYETNITKLNSMGDHLWTISADHEDLGLHSINRIVPIGEDDLLIMGLEYATFGNSDGILLRMNGNGELLWRVHPTSLEQSASVDKITDCWVDSTQQKIIAKGHSDAISSQQIFLFDFFGNQLNSYYLPEMVYTKNDRIFYKDGILLNINYRRLTRYAVSFTDYGIERLGSNVFSNGNSFSFSAAMIGSENVDVVSREGNIRQLNFSTLLTSPQTFGIPSIISRESTSAITSSPDGTIWALGENAQSQQTLTAITSSNHVTTTVSSYNSSRNNDVLALENGNIVSSFLATGVDGAPDTVGYRIIDNTNTILEEYLDIGNIPVDPLSSRAHLAKHPTDGFLLVISHDLIAKNNLIVRSEDSDQPIAFYNIWPEVRGVTSVAVGPDDEIAVISNTTQDEFSLLFLMSDLAGVVSVAQAFTPDNFISLNAQDFSANSEFNRFSVVVTHTQEGVDGVVLKNLLLDRQGTILSENQIPLEANAYVRGAAIETLSSGSSILVAAIDDLATIFDTKRYSLLHVKLDEQGGIISTNTNYTQDQPQVIDSDLSVDNTMIIGGNYWNSIDLDGLVVTFNDDGLITSSRDLSETDENLKLWPVPANNLLFIELENEYRGQAFINVRDNYGRICLNDTFTKQAGRIVRQLQIADLKPGIYFIEVIREGYSQTKAFIKL